MSGEQPVQVRLSGARELAVDGARHLGALVVATVGTLVAMSGVESLVPTASSLLNWAGIIASLAVATLFGHVLVTRIRGFVSLPASAFFSWLALSAAASMPMLGADRATFIGNLLLTALLSVPLVALATTLRAFVPPFRTTPARPRESEVLVTKSDQNL